LAEGKLLLRNVVYFTKHAREKFEILRKYGLKMAKELVIDAVNFPEILDGSRLPLYIAQTALDRRRALRVVYRLENGGKIIITFYPAKIKQNEKR
jgi:hypothetical protein